MGERTLRRLLVIGSAAIVKRWQGAAHRRAHDWNRCWRKPRMLMIVALANKMARIAWRCS
jgi:hypothetical protein